MTPPARDESMYLHDIVEAVDRILEYTASGRDAFLDERKTQDAVVRNLEIIGEAASKVPAAIRNSRPEVPWREIVAVRNRIAHEYFDIDIEVVWDIVSRDLAALRVQIAAILGEA